MNLLDIKGVGEKTAEKLNALEIFTPQDLLMFTPTKYIDMTPISISNARGGCFCVIKGTYIKKLHSVKNKKINLFAIQVADECGDIVEVEWFNQDYVSKIMSQDLQYIFYGRINEKNGKKTLINPEFELLKNAKKLSGIRVEYKTKGLLTNNKISSLIEQIKGKITLNSFISESLCKKYNLLPLNKAIINLHFPIKIQDLQDNLDRIKLEKIVNLMLAYHELSMESKKQRKMFYKGDKSIIDKAIKELDFSLTSSQQNAINKIINALNDKFNISYLLLGDVGSGKTVVALLICYYIIKSGGRAVMLVPSETLLNQHYSSTKFLQKLGVRVAKLSSSTTTCDRKIILEKLNLGQIDLILGTQSLISEDVNLSEFTFAVIDEQQKFGVLEKGKVLDKLKNADSLVLSATPIPRAINLMFNNSLQVVEIQKPTSKSTSVKTMLVSNNKLQDMINYIYQHKSEKTFIVCPNIYGSDSRLGVYDVYDYFVKKFNYKPLVINSKIAEDEKQQIMQDFASGKNNILIATSIVEVGIDVQDAKNMVILCSDRFGLSSLHQLRGRVGRDGSQANCFLHYNNASDKVIERLNILKHNTSGFEISKLDYNLRGGGEIFGTKQSGKADIIDFDILDSHLIELGQNLFSDIIKEEIDITKLHNIEKLFNNLSEIVLA